MTHHSSHAVTPNEPLVTLNVAGAIEGGLRALFDRHGRHIDHRPGYHGKKTIDDTGCGKKHKGRIDTNINNRSADVESETDQLMRNKGITSGQKIIRFKADTRHMQPKKRK